ncbi:amino acid ABC transporter permease [Mesorhizobium muleiense]|uniref:Polar amino acid transport system permease protein n=1 Tax=Mesorhizobium muleiense TaxID=1004279 RepID=A0A1G8U2S2_9HYPH|nr:amino acid ABC transporter permease [Mesorhizobium muleiense]MCF6101359.1 amino acid ABC transporter permease [Mesorhizobium muleiense]SDJ48126.1 polar amino acid transport system permease protein [Mesorhizobium muleiense]
MNYSFDFQSVTRNFGPLLDGLVVTLQLTAAANLIGLTLGFVVALMVMSRWGVVRWPATMFVEFFRCTPALVQIVWFFYCVPMLFNVFLGSVTMGIVALGLNLTAFNAEAYRASIQAVPREQLDAGIALGLNPLQRILYIVLPNAFRASVPVLLTNGIGIFQQSALVAIVAVQDLMYQGKTLATQTYRPIETFTIVALIYFAVSFPVGQLVGYLERRRATLAE